MQEVYCSVLVPVAMVDQLKKQISARHFYAAYTSLAMQLNMEDYLTESSHLHGSDEIRCTDDCLSDGAAPLEKTSSVNRNE